jgi:hypothetical protein
MDKFVVRSKKLTVVGVVGDGGDCVICGDGEYGDVTDVGKGSSSSTNCRSHNATSDVTLCTGSKTSVDYNDVTSEALTVINSTKQEHITPNTSCSPPVKVKKGGRKFQDNWIKSFSWIAYDRQKDCVFCSTCCAAASSAAKLALPSASNRDAETIRVFTSDGFSAWHKALERFKGHEKSEVHRASMEVMGHISHGHNIHAKLSACKQQEMKDSRVALLSIISSLRYLESGAIAVRGHTDESSNFIRLLSLRSQDVKELKSWLTRTSYKWLSHDIITELLTIMSHAILRQMSETVKSAQYYSIIVDETCDFSVHEQVSICVRYVDTKLTVHERFFGFYETSCTTAEKLFEIIKDALMRFGFRLTDCRGQCYDGAANMSGALTGVQSQFKAEESRAVYVHCLAHSLNLVVQDTMRQINDVRDFLNVARELITFVRGSPKRLALFESLQAEEDEQCVALRPFCPTRWCLRVVSLKTILTNYDALLTFLEQVRVNDKSDSGAKASGFVHLLTQFKSVFLLHVLITILERVETLNAALQRTTLNFHEGISSIHLCREALIYKRDYGFQQIWDHSVTFAKDNGVDEPEMPRVRKRPRRFDTDSTESVAHVFETPEDMFRPVFIEIADTAISGLNDRFQTSTTNHLNLMEDFVVGKSDGTELCEFYGGNSGDLNKNRLVLHRDMLHDMARAQDVLIDSVGKCLQFLTSDSCSAALTLLPEFAKFMRILLTIPVSSCCAERSFSALRRIKTYLRSTMTQQRLNTAAVMHVNRDITDSLNLEDVADDFIKRSPVRQNTFSMQA